MGSSRALESEFLKRWKLGKVVGGGAHAPVDVKEAEVLGVMCEASRA